MVQVIPHFNLFRSLIKVEEVLLSSADDAQVSRPLKTEVPRGSAALDEHFREEVKTGSLAVVIFA